jgi:hypothetical protein
MRRPPTIGQELASLGSLPHPICRSLYWLMVLGRDPEKLAKKGSHSYDDVNE